MLLAGLIIVRYLDITRLSGLTANGEPASLRHWRRYLVFLILVFGGLWLLAHGVAYFIAP